MYLLRKRMLLLVTVLMLVVLAACGSDDADGEDLDGDMDEDLEMLDVDFDVPETAEVGETIEMEALVTYGDDPVTDPEEVDYEIWEMCDKDNSIHEEPTNNDDGTYTLEHSFEEDGVYEVFAHTTAHNLHTMPKKQITVGEGGEYDCDEEEEDHDHEDHGDHDDEEEQ